MNLDRPQKVQKVSQLNSHRTQPARRSEPPSEPSRVTKANVVGEVIGLAAVHASYTKDVFTLGAELYKACEVAIKRQGGMAVHPHLGGAGRRWRA